MKKFINYCCEHQYIGASLFAIVFTAMAIFV